MIIKIELSRWFMIFLSFIPGLIGAKFRLYFLSFKSKKTNILIREFCYFEHIQNITLGMNITINQRCIINGSGNIDIGDNVLIGPRVTIYSVNYQYSNKNIPIAIKK